MRPIDNSFRALCDHFMASPQFKGYAENTKRSWGREFDFACRPGCLGAVGLDEIRPALIQGYLDGWSDRPGKQGAAKSAFKALEGWALVQDLLPRAIVTGVKVGRQTGGHVPWTLEQVLLGEKYARGDLARVISLGAETGQRISDLIRMGPTDLETNRGLAGINVVQEKTGRELWVPVTDRLAAIMKEWKREPGPLLRRRDGRAWDVTALTNGWIAEKARNAELGHHLRAGLVLHGLRGHRCVTLAREGLNDHQIGDLVGMSIPMVARYTRLSAQKENAAAAILNISQRKRA